MIEFYFDFLSPYAYLAHCRMISVDGVGNRLEYVPVDLASLKRNAGNTGPSTSEMPLKLSYIRTDMQRWARRYGVKLGRLSSFDSSFLNKGMFFALGRQQAPGYAQLAWELVYGDGLDMRSDATLEKIAAHLNWKPQDFLAFVHSEEAGVRLAVSNERAHSKGIFGVPTMMIGEDMWWGNDRVDMMIEEIETKHPRILLGNNTSNISSLS